MKKLMLVFNLIFLITVLMGAQSITVLKPTGGEKLTQGTSFVIQWNAIGTTNAFKVTLWRNNALVGVLKSSKNGGNGIRNFNWTVGKLENGTIVPSVTGYKVKVKERTTTVAGMSNEFDIRNKSSFSLVTPRLQKKPVIDPGSLLVKIQVTHPVEGGNYEGGKAMAIQWNKNFTQSAGAQVKISLHNAQNMKKLEDISLHTPNDGSFSWTPSISKYSWPGSKYKIQLSTIDHKFDGESGNFTIFAPATVLPAQPQKKTIQIKPMYDNKQASTTGGYPDSECLSVQFPTPGRPAKTAELKTGHFKDGGKSGKCYWNVDYKFFSNLRFGISQIKGKKILKAKLAIQLNEDYMKVPSGNLATNEFCNSQSRVFEGDTHIRSFSIFSTGDQTKIDLLDSVKNWAASGDPGEYKLTIKGRMDFVNNETSACLRYYTVPVLTVEYME